MRNLLQICLILVLHGCSFAQGGLSAVVESAFRPGASSLVSTRSVRCNPTGPQATVPQTTPGTPATLSLKDAQALALKNNPQISVARLTRVSLNPGHARSSIESVADRVD